MTWITPIQAWENPVAIAPGGHNSGIPASAGLQLGVPDGDNEPVTKQGNYLRWGDADHLISTDATMVYAKDIIDVFQTDDGRIRVMATPPGGIWQGDIVTVALAGGVPASKGHQWHATDIFDGGWYIQFTLAGSQWVAGEGYTGGGRVTFGPLDASPILPLGHAVAGRPPQFDDSLGINPILQGQTAQHQTAIYPYVVGQGFIDYPDEYYPWAQARYGLGVAHWNGVERSTSRYGWWIMQGNIAASGYHLPGEHSPATGAADFARADRGFGTFHAFEYHANGMPIAKPSEGDAKDLALWRISPTRIGISAASLTLRGPDVFPYYGKQTATNLTTIFGVNKELDFSVVGIGGIDQGSPQAGAVYNIFIVANHKTGAFGALASLAAEPLMPFGFSLKALVGKVLMRPSTPTLFDFAIVEGRACFQIDEGTTIPPAFANATARLGGGATTTTIGPPWLWPNCCDFTLLTNDGAAKTLNIGGTAKTLPANSVVTLRNVNNQWNGIGPFPLF